MMIKPKFNIEMIWLKCNESFRISGSEGTRLRNEKITSNRQNREAKTKKNEKEG